MASCCRCERSRESASSASSRSFSLKYLMTKTIATGNPNTARTLTMGMSAASISEDMAPVNVPDPGPFRAREKTKGPQAMTPAALRPLPRPQPLFVRSSGGRLVLERLAALLPPFAAALQPLAALLRALAGALLALAGALERLTLLDLALLDQLLAPLFLGFALLLELLAALLLALATALHALAAALQPVRAIGARRRRRDEQRRDHPVARLHGPLPAGSSLRRVGTVRRSGGKRPRPRGFRRRICADVVDRPPWAAARGAGRAPRGRRRRQGSPWPPAGRSTRAARPGLPPAPGPRP